MWELAQAAEVTPVQGGGDSRVLLSALSCFGYGDVALQHSQVLFQKLMVVTLVRRKVERLNNLAIF